MTEKNMTENSNVPGMFRLRLVVQGDDRRLKGCTSAKCNTKHPLDPASLHASEPRSERRILTKILDDSTTKSHEVPVYALQWRAQHAGIAHARAETSKCPPNLREEASAKTSAKSRCTEKLPRQATSLSTSSRIVRGNRQANPCNPR